MTARRQLLFVSPRFLFPLDSGGKIRTAQVLRGMKGGAFCVVLATPLPAAAARTFEPELASVCDRVASWPEPRHGRLASVTRFRHAASSLPIPVAADRSAAARRVVAAELARRPDVVVFDFAHAGVLLPPGPLGVPSVLFTHNVESRIFRRHAEVARNPLLRAAWTSQWRKMERFERRTLARFDTVVAVSDEDAAWFRGHASVGRVEVIPTGVDLGFYGYDPPGAEPRVVFTGSMDWLANRDGIAWMLDEVWPAVASARPDATMRVVGRNPPRALTARAPVGSWTFTGFVDDVRPWVRGAAAYAIPLRVGGGTRIKAYEALAMGCPVVSTTIGVEGLPLVPGEHYLRADTPAAFASAVTSLLGDAALRERLSRAGRALVEREFSARRAAEVFERICRTTADRPAPAADAKAGRAFGGSA